MIFFLYVFNVIKIIDCLFVLRWKCIWFDWNIDFFYWFFCIFFNVSLENFKLYWGDIFFLFDDFFYFFDLFVFLVISNVIFLGIMCDKFKECL